MINIDTIKLLVQSGLKAPSADNSQPWHFEWDGNVLSVKYDFVRVKGRTFPANSPATLLSLGTVIENILYISESYNISAELSWSPDMISEESSGAKISLQPINSVELSTTSINHPIFKRHTNRFAYHKTALPKQMMSEVIQLSEGSAQLLIIDSKPLVRELGQLIKIASEIRFQTKEVHEWLGESLRFTKEDVKKADGLDIRTLALPPGGSMFLKFISNWKRMKVLNHIGVYRLLAKIDAAPVKIAPAIVAIIAPPTPQGAVDAGRLLCKSWTFLNTKGVAIHPYYVIADQLTRLEAGTIPKKLTEKACYLKQQCTQALSLGEGETLHMLLRMGYPKRTPPQSLRLPEDVIFTDMSNN
jgi:hypothetical protein